LPARCLHAYASPYRLLRRSVSDLDASPGG
jgi:hypothetical protein